MAGILRVLEGGQGWLDGSRQGGVERGRAHRESGPDEGGDAEDDAPCEAGEKPVSREPGEEAPSLDVAGEDAGEMPHKVDVWNDHLGEDQGEEGREAEGDSEEDQVEAGR